MNKIHYITKEQSTEVKADLIFSYSANDIKVYAACDTIMDFIDTLESSEVDIPMLDYSDVHAVFFNNKHNTKDFNTIEELLNHCKQIIK